MLTPAALALHTSSPDLGLAIRDDSGRLQTQIWRLDRALATDLHAYLAEFIPPQAWQDFAFVAIAQGPGGFTSTRIGVVTARTLAQQLDIPVFAISSLAAIAHAESKQTTAQIASSTESGSLLTIAVEMPAQRGAVFGAVYEVASHPPQLTVVLEERAYQPAAWQQVLATWGSSVQVVQAPIEQGQYVTSVLELADWQWQRGERPHWSAALPFYGQSPVDP